MNTTNSIIVVAIILILGAGGWFLFGSQNGGDSGMMTTEERTMDDGGEMMESDAGEMNTPVMEKEDAMMEKGDGAMMAPEGQMAAQKGSYEAYAPEKLARASSGDVVLFFRASWCPTCRSLNADIQSHMNDIPKGVTILDVDYDNSTALKQKYGVTYQHTLVQVDAEGNLIRKWMGSPSLMALVGEIK